MNIFRTDKSLSFGWIGPAVVILLFACSVMVHAQGGTDRKKKDTPAPAAVKPAGPAPQSHGAANPAGGEAKQQNTVRPTRPDSGQGDRKSVV